MAGLYAFRGTRYDSSRVRLSDVVAPPYDVVGAADRAVLARRSPYNAIHVELPEEDGPTDRYRHAAELWARWHSEGIVAVDTEEAFYLYRMTFPLEDGSTRSTLGVIGALALDIDGAGDVLPHEETTPKDRHDRLSLLVATGTNLSPIWGLSLAGGLGELCGEAARHAAESFEALDDEGTRHVVHRVVDNGLVEEISRLVARTPVLIADGHHRYATACAHAKESGRAGSEAVMALVVELSPEQLAVEAIHRLVSGVGAVRLDAAISAAFERREGEDDPVRLYTSLRPGEIGLLTGRGNEVLVPRWREEPDELDTAVLGRVLADLPDAKVAFQHGVARVAATVRSGEAEAAFLLRPVSVERIATTAHGGVPMPPKTTYFRPKPRTGMVFRELEPR